MARAKKTGRCTSCTASRIISITVRSPGRGGSDGAGCFPQSHRAVHHHSEIERAQRKQIGGNIAQIQADGSKQQREGDGQDDDKRRPEIAEKEKQNDGDQQDALGQVVHHRVSSEVNQVAAIEKRNDLHARRQKVRRSDRPPSHEGRQHRVGACAFSQQHDAFDDIVVVENRAVFAMNRLCRSAQPDLGPLRDDGRCPARASACRSAPSERLPRCPSHCGRARPRAHSTAAARPE